MKDRIKAVMESCGMTQQEFADYIDISPATLSNIFTGRSRPTLSVVEAIKKELPDISTDWLMFGRGEMHESSEGVKAEKGVLSETSVGSTAVATVGAPVGVGKRSESGVLLDIDMPSSAGKHYPNGDSQQLNVGRGQRRITEIRIFYDDQTWETFVSKQ